MSTASSLTPAAPVTPGARRPHRLVQRRRSRINWEGLLTVVVLVALWQLFVGLEWIPFDYIATPSEIAVALRDLFQEGVLMERVWHTTSVAARAAAIGTAIGVCGGVLIGRVRLVRTYSNASIDFMRSIPVLALFPAAVLLWGPSGTSEVAVASYSATWQMLLNTAGGVRSVNPQLIDVARMLHLTPRERMTKVIVPAALPPILVGLRLAVVSALIVAIVAEMIINPRGVGWGLVEAANSLRPPRMWAYAVVAGVLGYLANAIVLRLVALVPAGQLAQDGAR